MQTQSTHPTASLLASLIAGSLRLRGKGGVPPQEGGWRELRLPPQ